MDEFPLTGWTDVDRVSEPGFVWICVNKKDGACYQSKWYRVTQFEYENALTQLDEMLKELG